MSDCIDLPAPHEDRALPHCLCADPIGGRLLQNRREAKGISRHEPMKKHFPAVRRHGEIACASRGQHEHAGRGLALLVNLHVRRQPPRRRSSKHCSRVGRIQAFEKLPSVHALPPPIASLETTGLRGLCDFGTTFVRCNGCNGCDGRTGGGRTCGRHPLHPSHPLHLPCTVAPDLLPRHGDLETLFRRDQVDPDRPSPGRSAPSSPRR